MDLHYLEEECQIAYLAETDETLNDKGIPKFIIRREEIQEIYLLAKAEVDSGESEEQEVELALDTLKNYLEK
jgi:hypothetical protein